MPADNLIQEFYFFGHQKSPAASVKSEYYRWDCGCWAQTDGVHTTYLHICTDHAMELFGIPRVREFEEEAYEGFLDVMTCKLIQILQTGGKKQQ